jgi:hypothetical protein
LLIIDLYEEHVIKEGKSKSMVKKELAATFDVSVRCIEKVIKKGRDYYLKELENGRANLMSPRARAAKYSELECALLSWIKQCMNDFPHRDLNITRYAVSIKAQLIAKDMKILNFHASRNWFQAFRRRHDLSFGRKQIKNQKDVFAPEGRLIDYFAFASFYLCCAWSEECSIFIHSYFCFFFISFT